jgi:uncharacterized protein YaaW (UPF0174 family)
MDNFGFLKAKWPDLAEIGYLAEMNLDRDPNTVLTKLRLFGELTTIQIMKEEGLPEPMTWEDRRFWVRLLKIRDYKVVPEFILDHLHALRMAGNKANHENYGDPHLAAAMLLKAFAIGVWLMQTYGPPDFVPPEFRWEEGQDKKVGGEENPRILLFDLFVPYAQVRDEDLRTLVAILQNTNIANYLKETGSKLSNLLTKKLNQAGGLFGQEVLVPEVEIRKVSDLINTAAQNLRGCTRQELITLFQAELAKRVKLNGVISPEALSVAMINEAAKGLRLDNGLSLAQKAQLIYERYKERLWEEAQKWAKQFSVEERKKVTVSLDESLGRLKEEERSALEKSLGVERLTGTIILKALTGAAGPLSLIALVELTGFGAYLMLTTVLHAVFTTMLGITLPFAFYTGATSLLSFLTGPFGWLLAVGFGGVQLRKGTKEINRNLLAMMIWFSLSHYQGQVVPWDEDLPSWAEGEEREKVEAVDHRISKLQEESAALAARLATTADRLKKAEANQRKLYTEKQQATFKRDGLVDEKRKLDTALADGTWQEQQITPVYQEKARVLLRKIGRTIPAASRLEKLIPEEEEQYRRVIAKKAEAIKGLQQNLAELEEKLANSVRQIKQVMAERDTLQTAVEATDQQLEAYLTPRIQEIKNLWELNYPRLGFSEQALRWVAQLPLAQRLVVERYLLELNELNNPGLLADGESTVDGKKAPYLLIQLTKGERVRLIYFPKPDGKTEIIGISG